MENQELLDNNLYGSGSAAINSATKDLLRQAGNWSRFIAVLGFFGSALIISFGFFINRIIEYFRTLNPFATHTATPAGMWNWLTVFYIILGLIFLYPNIRLWQFASNARNISESDEQTAMEDAIKRLRSYFRFWGIFYICMLILYAIVIISATTIKTSVTQ